jgi:hypothetical protein
MTTTDDKTKAQLHRREVLNSIIDLLESLPDKQQQTDVVISAAAAVGVSVTPPKPSAGRGYAPSRKRSY